MQSRTPLDNEISPDRPMIAPERAMPELEDRVTSETPAPSANAGHDRVTFRGHSAVSHTARRAVPPASPFVLPNVRQMLSLVAPVLVASISLGLAYLVASMRGTSSAIFIVPMVIPGLILGALHGNGASNRWRESVGINLATMLILFPLLIIRQSTVRVPYLDFAHGTVYAAMLSTAAVLIALAGLAVTVAWISREDPESSAILFMPAAMLVPLLTSATEFAELDSALLVTGLIFVLAAILAMIASIVPPAYVVFVAPLAVAFEVLFVTLVRQDRIFPVGVNEAGMALFATVVVSAIALVVMLPSLSIWMSKVDRFRELQQRALI